jgi:hypothetical protein
VLRDGRLHLAHDIPVMGGDELAHRGVDLALV